VHSGEQRAREDPARVCIEFWQQRQQWPLELRKQRMADADRP
jgi:hypothetical protein